MSMFFFNHQNLPLICLQAIIMAYLKIVCLLLVLHCACAATLADFKPALFHSSRPSGFYQINTGSDNTGLILAFEDLNGDQYTDYIAIEDLADAALTAFIWNDANSAFRGFPLQLNYSGFTQVAEALICDVDSDELLEVVVTFLKDKQYSSQIYDVSCSHGGCNATLQQLDYSLLTNMTAVPFLLDPDGSGHINIFTFTPNGRIILKYDLTAGSPKLQSSTFASLVLNPSQNYNTVGLHFAGNLDFNGDCNSDLLLLSLKGSNNSVLQCFQKANGNSYQQLPSILLPKNVSWLTFADLDSNGAVDIFLVASEGSSFLPYAILNPYVPDDICQSQSAFPFAVNQMSEVKLPAGYALASNSNIKFSDVNLDGLPDMLGLFTIGKFKRATILLNGGSNVFNQVVGLNIEEVATVDNPVQICAFDLGEDGKMDVLVVNQVATEGGDTAYLRTSVVNNIIDDSLFIKILPLLTTSGDFDTHRTASATGITVQWRITDINGDKTIDTLNQKPQWNFGTLQLPFVTGGLGRTNNYIEDLAVGYPGRGQVEIWTPVIPNSQLMVRREVDSDWALETLLKDNSRVYDVIYISIICLLFLGLVVFYLNWRENQEDKRDHYNFIQMIR